MLSADRATPAEVEEEPGMKHPVGWIDSPLGELIAFSAETGERLWSSPCREGFHASVDVLLELLLHRDPLVRSAARHALRSIIGTSAGYRPFLEPAEQEDPILAWKDLARRYREESP